MTTPQIDLTILQRLYDSEINISLEWTWDGGIEVWMAGPVAGKRGQAQTVAEALAWLDAQARALYPDSQYAKEPR